ncbi:hypothetical protein Dimus_014072, partial [Dionaea muscipula]
SPTPPKGSVEGEMATKGIDVGDALAVVMLDDSALIDAEVIQANSALIVGECSQKVEIEEDLAWGDRAEVPRSPYLRAVKNGLEGDCDQKLPNPLADNRDTRRGFQLSNEEEREGDLVFTLEDVASEREFWALALI